MVGNVFVWLCGQRWPFFVCARMLVWAWAKRTMSAAAIAQLGERQTEDLKVPGSIPGLGICCLHVHVLIQFEVALRAAGNSNLGRTA